MSIETTMNKRKSQDIARAGVTDIPAASIDGNLWALIIGYLPANDLKSLRLASSKSCLHFYNPLFTSHLPLRMDLVPFFGIEPISQKYHSRHMLRWMHNRRRLVIQGTRTKNIHPAKVEVLIERGYMQSVTTLTVDNCAHHRLTIGQLTKLPNLKHLELSDRYPYVAMIDQKGKYYDSVVRITSAIVDSIGFMTKLESLEIDLDCIVNGHHLSVLQKMKGLKSLCLRGFDFSDGLQFIASLTQLEHLEVCHGNTCHTSESLIQSNAFASLMNRNLKSLHMENMDHLSYEHVKPLSQLKEISSLTFKHCQEMKGDILSSIGTMTSLQELHFINCPMDSCEAFESEELEHLRNLKNLKTLTLMFVLIDQYDILDLEGLDELETLNVGLHRDMCQEEFNQLINTILPVLPKLKRVRIFGMEPEHYDVKCGDYDVEVRYFDVGGSVELD